MLGCENKTKKTSASKSLMKIFHLCNSL